MRRLAVAVLFCFPSLGFAAAPETGRVTVIRDNWGIAHVYGKSDADAVFGSAYAQAEDDFSRIERNYLISLGWLAQAEGEKAIWSDLRQRMFVDVADLKQHYQTSPAWLKALMQGWADGLNTYLAAHPETKPKVITHFEPWMALSFTEGSIGGTIEDISLEKLENFYDSKPAPDKPKEKSPGGSNGFAIAPKLTADGHALLLINPHTTFYFRSELQMTSEEGLDAYGVSTWGQFFLYQGFNPHNGWMHTSDGGDTADDYVETVVEKKGALYTRYGRELRKVSATKVTIPYRRGGGMAEKEFTIYRSTHGPIIRAEGGKWVAVKMLAPSVEALEQSWLRTKTSNYQEFYKTQEMRTDASNNTVYADTDGTIAYFHGNFIPKRNPAFDYTKPVDGSDPRTDWQGPHKVSETITLLNPKSGWIQNTNNWPFHAAGADSPKQDSYPRYMWTAGENPRGLHAVQLLEGANGFTLDGLIASAYDTRLPGFDILLPPLLAAYGRLDSTDPRKARLADPIESLRQWDHRSGVDSAPTALAIFWGQTLIERKLAPAREAGMAAFDYLAEKLTDADRIDALTAAVAKLQADFGNWKTPWGEINRLQRVSDDIVQEFDDAKPSLAIGMAPSKWGALASFDSKAPHRTRRIYGTVGNGNVFVIEFGPKIRAKAMMAGGESGHADSPHFFDQALPYQQVKFRDVYFYRDEVEAHAERIYHPGE